MRAIQITQTGGAEVLQLRELPTPTPGPGEALIQIEACGVNFIDIYLREGRYPSPLPFIPGQEAAGVVAGSWAGCQLASKSATASPGAAFPGLTLSSRLRRSLA